MLPKLEPGLYEKMKTRLVTQWKTYEAPELDEQGNLKNPVRRPSEQKAPKHKSASDDSEEDEAQLQLNAKLERDLPDGCLKVNLGIPILVLVNKSDLLLHGDKKAQLEENFDFIQKHIREYSLQYGATVLFTSGEQKRNLDVCYQYLLHRLYDMDLPFAAEVQERDTLFVPAGFDTPLMIGELIKGTMFQGPSGDPLLYEEVVT